MKQGRSRIVSLALCGLAMLGNAPSAQGSMRYAPPRLAVASFDQLVRSAPHPYDQHRDADKALDAARQRAKRTGKMLLLDLGANWCISCRALSGTLQLETMRRFVDKHFVLVTVDVGRFDRNMHIPTSYGVDQLPGLPSLLVIDPQRDELVNEGEVSIFAHLKRQTPQAIADWLAKWAR